MAGPDVRFWQERFRSGETPWDRGGPSPQLQTWMHEGLLGDGAAAPLVAVPGCGSGHELVSLARFGARVIGLDYAPEAVAQSLGRLEATGHAGRAQVLEADVLCWQPDEPVDVVYEQTCLCALHPDHWSRYAAQLHGWLRTGGRLLALVMQARRSTADRGLIEGPPYHVDINAMRALFPASQWSWPKPPFAVVAHPLGAEELAVALTRR